VKIALVTETFPPEVNGVAMTFGIIARELAARKHEITVYRPRRPTDAAGTKSPAGTVPNPLGKGHPASGRDGHVRVVPMPGMPIPGYAMLRMGFPARGALKRRWSKERPDLVHVVTEGPLGASAVAAAQALGIPVTSSYHTQFHEYAGSYGLGLLRPLTLAWLRRVHNRTLRTFAPTEEIREELTKLGFRDLAVLSRGIDLRLFHPGKRSSELRAAWGAGPGDPVVLHAGRMAPEKNYTLLLEAFTAMRAAQPRLRCVLVGDGPLRARLRRDFPWASFAGFMDREALGRHYASADLYVHASLTETFGNVLTEAMACGLAPATFDYAAGRMFVRHGGNGLTAPRDRPDLLVAAGVRLARETGLRARLGQAAAATMAAQSWDVVIARFERDLSALVPAS
jgi:glycosyltransferase involved in cell wall biosynthesis